MSWSICLFFISAFIFGAGVYDGDFWVILIALPFIALGFVALYFEDKPVEKSQKYNLKIFISNWVDGGKGILFMIGIYAVMVALACGFFSCMNSCTNSGEADYPYHNAETGKGQYKYEGSKEQKRDLERIDDYIKRHPNE